MLYACGMSTVPKTAIQDITQATRQNGQHSQTRGFGLESSQSSFLLHSPGRTGRRRAVETAAAY